MADKQVGYLFRTNSAVELLTPKKTKLQYEELRAGVGGYIQMVELKGGVAWVNEEGLYLDPTPNWKATRIIVANMKYDYGDKFVGNIIIIPYKTWKGEDLSKLLYNVGVLKFT